MSLSIKELFINDGTSLSRLPLWIKKSFLIKTTYEIYLSGGEDETEPYFPPIDTSICTVPILNVLWNIMIGHTDLNGQYFNDVFSAANYLDLKHAMEELCNYFLNSSYVGKLIDQPDYLTFTISQKKPLLDFWWNSFMNAVNSTVRDDVDTGEIYRLWSPTLFWDTKPVRKTHTFGYECAPGYQMNYYYLFWDTLNILPGIARIERFLWEAGLINALAVAPLPYALCPILGYSLEPITNEFTNAEIQRYQYYADRPPEWLLRVLHMIPEYILHCPESNRQYSIIVKWIQCNFQNYVDATLYLVPPDYIFNGRSLIDWAADSLSSAPIITTLFEHGHKPTQAIFDILLTVAIVRRNFLTGWNHWLCSTPNFVVMTGAQMAEWRNAIIRFTQDVEMWDNEYNYNRGNSFHILTQLKQIYEWNIYQLQSREQFEGINLDNLVLT